jgi:cbb3-type cytochrome oxidase maturation protein
MTIIFLLLPLSLFLVLLFVILYLWAVRHHQFEDLDTPARRILLDDSPPAQSEESLPSQTNNPTT